MDLAFRVVERLLGREVTESWPSNSNTRERAG
jgi:hypothetical protein